MPAMAAAPVESRTLGSWKEIAAYLGKGVRTVQRWEHQLGLPVRRPDSLNRGVVSATPEELDQWLRSRWTRRAIARNGRNGDDKLSEGVRTYHELHRANAVLVGDLVRYVQELQDKCEALTRITKPLADASKVRPTQAKRRRK